MYEPVEFQILEDLQAALRDIRIDSGYHYDIAELAVKLDPNHEVEALIGEEGLRPFMVLELPPGAFEYEQSGQVRFRMPFTVHAVSESDSKLDDSLLKTYLRLAADIERAIAQDDSRGGLATDTRIFSRQMRVHDGEQVWAQVRGEITGHREYGEPDG